MDLQPAQQGTAMGGALVPLRQDNAPNDSRVVETDIPARLDALHWSGFHTRVVVALGITWILDGLEVTLTGSVSGVLQSHEGLGLSDDQSRRLFEAEFIEEATTR